MPNDVTGTHAYTTTTTALPGPVRHRRPDRQVPHRRHHRDRQRTSCLNVIGSATNTDGRALTFPGGHYISVVGYDDHGQRMKVAGPWQPVGDGTYWMTTDDLANWMATRGYTA